MTLTVFVPGKLVNPLNARMHWAAQARWAKNWRRTTALIVGDMMKRAAWREDATVPKRVTFIAHVARLMDRDGVIAALKPAVDGLRDARLIHDDDPVSGHEFGDPVQVVDRKGRGVEITVTVAPARPGGAG